MKHHSSLNRFYRFPAALLVLFLVGSGCESTTVQEAVPGENVGSVKGATDGGAEDGSAEMEGATNEEAADSKNTETDPKLIEIVQKQQELDQKQQDLYAALAESIESLKSSQSSEAQAILDAAKAEAEAKIAAAREQSEAERNAADTEAKAIVAAAASQAKAVRQAGKDQAQATRGVARETGRVADALSCQGEGRIQEGHDCRCDDKAGFFEYAGRCLDMKKGAGRVEDLKITLQTGNHRGAGSDTSVFIEFCPGADLFDADHDLCNKFSLDQPKNDDFDQSYLNTYTLQDAQTMKVVQSENKNAAPHSKSPMVWPDSIRYFKVSVRSKGEWLLGGIKVEAKVLTAEKPQAESSGSTKKSLTGEKILYLGDSLKLDQEKYTQERLIGRSVIISDLSKKTLVEEKEEREVEPIRQVSKWVTSYANPVANKWLYPDGAPNHAVFGPFDTAVAALFHTSKKKGAGTDDAVFLYFPKSDAVSFTRPLESADAPTASVDPKDGRMIRLSLDWMSGKKHDGGWDDLTIGPFDADASDYDDFEKRDLTSYGYTFTGLQGDPLEPRFQVRKLHPSKGTQENGKDGAWLTDKFQVVLFHPGDPKFLASSNECFSYNPNGDITNALWIGKDDVWKLPYLRDLVDGDYYPLARTTGCTQLHTVDYKESGIAGKK